MFTIKNYLTPNKFVVFYSTINSIKPKLTNNGNFNGVKKGKFDRISFTLEDDLIYYRIEDKIKLYPDKLNEIVTDDKNKYDTITTKSKNVLTSYDIFGGYERLSTVLTDVCLLYQSADGIFDEYYKNKYCCPILNKFYFRCDKDWLIATDTIKMFKNLSTDSRKIFLLCYDKVLTQKEIEVYDDPSQGGLVEGIAQAKKLLSLLQDQWINPVTGETFEWQYGKWNVIQSSGPKNILGSSGSTGPYEGQTSKN